MLHQSVLSNATPMSGTGATETIQSRFGQITVDTSKALSFPRGLLGMPNRFHFVLANFPSDKMQQFTLLQSLDDTALSFITLPVAMDNSIIAAQDIRQAAADLQMPEASLAILLMVSVHRSVDTLKLSVNARAPLLIDAERKTAVQYVFHHDTYKVQHMLTTAAGAN